jgi:hypothetical protein
MAHPTDLVQLDKAQGVIVTADQFLILQLLQSALGSLLAVQPC